jgi:hypothetical protein
VIPAGGSGKLRAKIKTSPLQDRSYNKSISVHTNAPGEEYLRLNLIAKSVAAISLKPKNYLTISALEGEAASSRIYLHRNDGKALEVSGVIDDLPADVRIRTGEVQAAMDIEGGRVEAGDVWVELELAVGQAVVRGSGRLTVRTNHPHADELQIPVRLWMKPLIDVRPNRVNLWVHRDQRQQRTITVRMTHSQQQGFELGDVEVSHPELFTATVTTQGSQVYHVLRLELAEGIDLEAVQSAVSGSVRVPSSEPQKPIVEIPVMISVRGQRRRPSARGGSLPTPTVTGSAVREAER